MKWLVAVLLLAGSTYALNSLSEMNVVVFPDVPNTVFQYDFIFSSASSCSVLLNVSQNITTNALGRGNATLDVSGLSPTPSYLCTYRSGTLVNKQSLNPNVFEAGNVTGNGMNSSSGLHVYQTSATALTTGNLSENPFQLYYPNSLLLGVQALLVNATTNRVGVNTTNPTSTLEVYGNLSVATDIAAQQDIRAAGNITTGDVVLNSLGYPFNDGTPEYWNPYTLEFTNCNANAMNPFLGTATSAGTIATQVGNESHPGICTLSDSTTANGNYRVMSDVGAFMINGTERARFIFQTNGVRVTQGARLGFMDSTAIQTQPTDGVFFNITAGTTLAGVARNNNVQTVTASTYALTATTWYNGIIQVNDDASQVTFYLYDATGTLLWNDTIAANIPHTLNRETGFGVIAGETTVDAGAVILRMDFMNLQIRRRLR